MTGIYIKGEYCNTEAERDRECIMYKPRTAGDHQKLGERHGTDPPLEPSEGANPADNVIVDF